MTSRALQRQLNAASAPSAAAASSSHQDAASSLLAFATDTITTASSSSMSVDDAATSATTSSSVSKSRSSQGGGADKRGKTFFATEQELTKRYPPLTELPKLATEADEEKRRKFYAELLPFLERRNQFLVKWPIVGLRYLDLHALWSAVIRRGGVDVVIRTKSWARICDEFDLPATCTNAGFVFKQHYVRWLFPFEMNKVFGIEESKIPPPSEIDAYLPSVTQGPVSKPAAAAAAASAASAPSSSSSSSASSSSASTTSGVMGAVLPKDRSSGKAQATVREPLPLPAGTPSKDRQPYVVQPLPLHLRALYSSGGGAAAAGAQATDESGGGAAQDAEAKRPHPNPEKKSKKKKKKDPVVEEAMLEQSEQDALINSLFTMPSEPIIIGTGGSVEERRTRRVSSRLAGDTTQRSTGGSREDALEYRRPELPRVSRRLLAGRATDDVLLHQLAVSLQSEVTHVADWALDTLTAISFAGHEYWTNVASLLDALCAFIDQYCERAASNTPWTATLLFQPHDADVEHALFTPVLHPRAKHLAARSLTIIHNAALITQQVRELAAHSGIVSALTKLLDDSDLHLGGVALNTLSSLAPRIAPSLLTRPLALSLCRWLNTGTQDQQATVLSFFVATTQHAAFDCAAALTDNETIDTLSRLFVSGSDAVAADALTVICNVSAHESAWTLARNQLVMQRLLLLIDTDTTLHSYARSFVSAEAARDASALLSSLSQPQTNASTATTDNNNSNSNNDNGDVGMTDAAFAAAAVVAGAGARDMFRSGGSTVLPPSSLPSTSAVIEAATRAATTVHNLSKLAPARQHLRAFSERIAIAALSNDTVSRLLIAATANLGHQ